MYAAHYFYGYFFFVRQLTFHRENFDKRVNIHENELRESTLRIDQKVIIFRHSV